MDFDIIQISGYSNKNVVKPNDFEGIHRKIKLLMKARDIE